MNSSAHTGAAGELFACSYFLAQGLEVARNVAPSGPVDLIVYNKENGRMVAVDVKSHSFVAYRVDGSLGPQYSPRWVDNIAVVKYLHGEPSVSVPEGFWEALGIEMTE